MFSKIHFTEKLFFTKHLAVMIKSGIILSEALESLVKNARSEPFRVVLSGVLKGVRNGESLTESLKKYPHVFDHFYTSLIEVSEESGTLDKNLDFLAGQLAKDYAMRKKIQAALMYPSIVIIAMAVVGGGVGIFVLPKLVELFSRLNVELPITTKIVLFFANVMKSYGVIIIGLFLGLSIYFRYLISSPRFKPYWDSMLLSLPVFGVLMQNAQLALFTRNLGVMLKSGIPINKALKIQKNVSGNYVFQHYVSQMQKAVDKGKSLEEELDNGSFSKFSPIAIRMIGVGEKTGKLDEIFLYLGDFFEEEVDASMRNLSVIIEPVLLLIIGVVLGFVALTIITPIYQLTGSIGRH